MAEVKRSNYQIVTAIRATLAMYKKENGIEDYTEKTVLDDLLYIIGAALSDEYRMASGYDRFKQRLIDHLSR